MATWTDPATIDTSPDSPVTSEFGTAALENVAGFAEGASGAPRMASKNQFGNDTSGNVDFDVTGMGGARFAGSVRNTGGAARELKINGSDGTLGTAQVLVSISAGDSLFFHGYVDFATGSFSVVESGAAITTGTLTVTGNLTTLRFGGASDLVFAVHNMPDGGETAT